MSNQINDGGPAFPHLETTSRGEPYHDHLGMTLRDYFAAAALQGLLAKPNLDFKNGKVAAFASYDIADAMIKAREAKP